MISNSFRLFRNLAFGATSLVILHSCGTAAAQSAPDLPHNEGGALVLHAYPEIDASSFRGDCGLLVLEDVTATQVQLPGDGTPWVVGVHMSFPPEDSISVSGISFGLEQTGSVDILRYGFCKTADGIVIPDGAWPGTESNVGMYFGPAHATNNAVIAWFVVASDGPGSLSLAPSTDMKSGAAFATGAIPGVSLPYLAPIGGLGRIGFGPDQGVVPVVGNVQSRGICCVGDECFAISQSSCDYYLGLFLGSDTDCESGPCDANAGQGACCLFDGCQLSTRRECFAQAGYFLGEGTTCEETDCGR